MSSYENYGKFAEWLRSRVPPEIDAIVQRGGLNDRDHRWLAQEWNDDPEDLCPANVLMRADQYLLYADVSTEKKRQKIALAQATFVKTIALFALHQKSGVRFFGVRFFGEFPYFEIDD